ncbi:MAG: dihydroxyacetone kinase subunit DhaL [Rhodobacteraceae bacterium]|nr:dihydroxyacetone kinase subunit DhaL [Paracoccaceae bacterium]MCY4197359.1 dihydroxyacetone kinase subunit DhaL [Paracoccaceae bacterium]
MTGDDLKAMLLATAAAMDASKDQLCALDGEIGDADHGIAMSRGFGAIRTALDDLTGETPTGVFNAAARAFLNEVGASSGPLYATAFMRAAAILKGKETVGANEARDIVVSMADGIAKRGKAERGDKTMLDAWGPASEAIQRTTPQSVLEVFKTSAEAAKIGAEETVNMLAKKGRAARLGVRSLGHRDPGAVSAALILDAMAAHLEENS